MTDNNETVTETEIADNHQQPVSYRLDIPKQLAENFNQDDQGIEIAKELAEQNGLSADQFNNFVGGFLTKMHEQGLLSKAETPQPTAEDQEQYLSQEKAKLGPDANNIINRVADQADNLARKGIITQDELSLLNDIAVDAATVRLIDKIFGQIKKQQNLPVINNTDNYITPQNLEAMVADPRYQNDPLFRSQVSQAFEKKYKN